MQYTKPELNVIGAAESLVLGASNGSRDGGEELAAAEFEFED
jgi:hypothetical protein